VLVPWAGHFQCCNINNRLYIFNRSPGLLTRLWGGERKGKERGKESGRGNEGKGRGRNGEGDKGKKGKERKRRRREWRNFMQLRFVLRENPAAYSTMRRG